jgi:hypothetical protein
MFGWLGTSLHDMKASFNDAPATLAAFLQAVADTLEGRDALDEYRASVNDHAGLTWSWIHPDA